MNQTSLLDISTENGTDFCQSVFKTLEHKYKSLWEEWMAEQYVCQKALKNCNWLKKCSQYNTQHSIFNFSIFNLIKFIA